MMVYIVNFLNSGKYFILPYLVDRGSRCCHLKLSFVSELS